MAAVTINYSKLEDAGKYAKKLSGNLNGYVGEINRRVISPLNNLPGNDNRGYAYTAASSAGQKIRALQDSASRFDTFSNSIEQFVASARNADNTVAKSIKTTAKSYVGERSAWEAFWDSLWNAVVVDFCNKYSFVRLIKDCASTIWNHVTSVAEKVYDWFKHDAGKYVWNIVSAVVAVGAAVIATVGAIAAIATAGTVIAMVLAVVAAAAAVVGLVITTVNSGVKIYNNAKALKASSEDDPGRARYLGTIDGYSDAVKKYDMGDESDNRAWETSGKVVDTTKTVCDVIGVVKGITDLGAVKNAQGVIEGYNFNKKTVFYNIKKSMGFKYSTSSKTKGIYKSKNELGKYSDYDVTKSWFKSKSGPGLNVFNKLSKGNKKTVKTVANTVNIVQKSMKTVEKMDKIHDRAKTEYDFSTWDGRLEFMEEMGYTVIDTYDLMGSIKLMKGMNSVTVKPFKAYDDIKTIIENWSDTSIGLPVAEGWE